MQVKGLQGSPDLLPQRSPMSRVNTLRRSNSSSKLASPRSSSRLARALHRSHTSTAAARDESEEVQDTMNGAPSEAYTGTGDSESPRCVCAACKLIAAVSAALCRLVKRDVSLSSNHLRRVWSFRLVLCLSYASIAQHAVILTDIWACGLAIPSPSPASPCMPLYLRMSWLAIGIRHTGPVLQIAIHLAVLACMPLLAVCLLFSHPLVVQVARHPPALLYMPLLLMKGLMLKHVECTH